MRKTTKKVVSVALASSMVLGMTACGNSSNNPATDGTTSGTTTASNTDNNGETSATQSQGSSDVVKPEKIKVMMDATVVTKDNGRDAFEQQLEEALGIDIEFVQPDHSGYYDSVGTTFASGDLPDVVLLGASYYSSYVNMGALADISSYWENSELKASGRIVNESIIDSLYIDGGLYGFSPARGNGCLTYIKQAWLDKANLQAPTNWDEYLNMIKTFTEMDMDGDGDPSNDYGVSAAGLIGAEAPYTNFLPEIYQDAYPDFYKNESGQWVDGFSEDAMKEALQRLQDVYTAGYLDKETLTNGTKDVRNKYYADKFGVFTYWAGTWQSNIEDNLIANGLDSEVVALPPIAEVGNYVERQAPVWCITSTCKNPEGVFKYFIETMLDDGQVQTLWTYGAKGTHWDDKAETFTCGGTEYTYEEGQFHMLPTPEKPDTLMKKNHLDPMLSIATFSNDPGKDAQVDSAVKSQAVFNEYAKMAPVIVSNDTVNSYSGDLWDIRKAIIADTAQGKLTVEEAMKQYEEKASSIVAEVLASLNN